MIGTNQPPLALCAVAVFSLAGCSVFSPQAPTGLSATTSLQNYLYPGGTSQAPTFVGTMDSRLALMQNCRFGVAFIPNDDGAPTLSSKQQAALIAEVDDALAQLECAEQSVAITPQQLAASTGAQNLAKLSEQAGVSYLALISYEASVQKRTRPERGLFQNVAGVNLGPDEAKQLRIRVDTSLFDGKDGALLFRAQGDQATPIEGPVPYSASELALQSYSALEPATEKMLSALDMGIGATIARQWTVPKD